MKNPFKVGDKVYHIFYGEGEVLDPDAQNHVKDNGRTVLVKFLCGEIRQYAPKELSFKPWAQPDHTRPPEDGLFIITTKAPYTSVAVRELKGGCWYYVDGNLLATSYTGVAFKDYTIIKKVI